MGREQDFGFKEGSGDSSGGYETQDLNGATSQGYARDYCEANEAAAANKTKMQGNHVGGPYAGA